ncbi:hypothetical protein [Pedobacter aquatilis]|uniref:hypothetical protein n=1 Tax=Pedobacter aquatilis TaxID=351343 RepID=UPI00292EF985|nr:hypothetical protein [Pedobacter aquatilis]
MKKIILSLALLFSTAVFAQVGINNKVPKATLDITAKTIDGTKPEGLIAPRLSGAQIKAASSQYGTDQTGTIIFATSASAAIPADPKTANINAAGYYYFDGSAWQKILTGAGSSDLTNDAWVNDASNAMVKLGTNADGTTSRAAGTEFVAKDNGTVGIGTASPNSSAILDLSTSNKGLLAPRIGLKSFTDQTTVPSPATGLLIYNTGADALKYKGYVFWNGSEWRSLNNTTLINPRLTKINCNTAYLTPGTYTANTAYSGVLTIPYSDGNGGQYEGGTSTTSNGLTFKLLPGTLAYGYGYLYFVVTGKPTLSSPAPSNISINSTLIPFYAGTSCMTVDVGTGDEDPAGTSVTASYDINEFTPSSSVTCFDGSRLCVRYNGITANQIVQMKQEYGSTQVMLAYSFFGSESVNGGSERKFVKSLAENTWTDIYNYGGANNTEAATSIVTLFDKITFQARTYQVTTSIASSDDLGSGRSKLFIKITKY